MKLKHTCDQMCSEDYKDRFIAEYCQAVIRYRKLEKMLAKWDMGLLDFVPDCPRAIYNFQIRAMVDYIGALETRAVIENIELPEMGKEVV